MTISLTDPLRSSPPPPEKPSTPQPDGSLTPRFPKTPPKSPLFLKATLISPNDGKGLTGKKCKRINVYRGPDGLTGHGGYIPPLVIVAPPLSIHLSTPGAFSGLFVERFVDPALFPAPVSPYSVASCCLTRVTNPRLSVSEMTMPPRAMRVAEMKCRMQSCRG
jgi:hypothetical protein